MKVAILGTRGIPASYSGFETAAEQLASRLSDRGHEVFVYCRPHVVDRRLREWRGARLVHLPTVRNKYLDTFVHTALSSVHAAHAVRPDVALFFIAGNSPMTLVTRRAQIPTVINVDGLDSDRSKWPGPAKAYLRFAERNAPALGRPRADRLARRRGDLRAALRAADRRGALRRRRPWGRGHLDARAPRARARQATSSSSGASSPRTTPIVLVEAFARIPAARARGMKLVIVGGRALRG